jgi:hypothetical protein
VTDWLAQAVAQVHPLLREWYSPAPLEANLKRQLERDLDWLENLGEGFERHLPVIGATPAMDNHRVLEVDGTRVMLGIRFRGGEITLPFVDVVRSSQPVTSADQVRAISDLVRREFAVFKPLKLRFYQPAHLEFQFELPGASGDKRVLAAPLAAMLAQPAPDGLERVTLQRGTRATDLEFYERYVATYAEAYLERPWLPNESEPESPEDMREHLENGQIFEIFVDGHGVENWSGVTGTEPDTAFGLRGFLVLEMLLAKNVRGQRLGAAVQRRLAEAMVASGEPGDVLYGTIGSNNPPMLTTATRAGRVDVGGWFWTDLNA